MQAGHEVSQRCKIQDGIVLNPLAAHRTDRNRHVLQAFSALLRRHDNFFQLRLSCKAERHTGHGDKLVQLFA